VPKMLPPAGLRMAGPPAWYRSSYKSRRLSEETYQFLKRALDLVLVLIALPLVLLLITLCALAVWLDSPGPLFFYQQRTGIGGRRFKMWKLRTMVVNAEELKVTLAHLNELTYPDFKITNDPRVTRVGRILRRTSLDELPQLLNVLTGDMSLVGPRPTSFSANTYCLWHTARLELKPGITGLWQISGRADVDFDERLRLDIAYLRNRSLLLDVQILCRTVGAVISSRGAN
jgi:lipopolysaccharide/colanic/teichoic acid biosynthesis glycosyltransferase